MGFENAIIFPGMEKECQSTTLHNPSSNLHLYLSFSLASHPLKVTTPFSPHEMNSVFCSLGLRNMTIGSSPLFLLSYQGS
jgi:hypothetical protein